MRLAATWRRGGSVLVIVLGVLVAPATGFAQDAELEGMLDDEPALDLGLDPDPAMVDLVEPTPAPIRDPRAAKKLADGAARFAKKGDQLKKRKKDAEAAVEYERALAAYDKSFELLPAARILVLTAGLEEKLGRWYEAAGRYERALAETELPLDDKGRFAAADRLDAARMYLGVVVLMVSPDGAAIKLDGAELGAAPLAAPLTLRPGEYALEISAEEFVTLETRLVVDAGSESERRFELLPVPVVVARPRPAPPPPPPPPPPLPEVSRAPLLISAGATVVLTGLAVATGAMAIGEHGTFEDPASTAAQRQDAQASGKRLALMSDLFTGGALVGAGVTAYYYLKVYRPRVQRRDAGERERRHDEYSRRRSRDRGPKVLVTPTVQASGGGLALTGWF